MNWEEAYNDQKARHKSDRIGWRGERDFLKAQLYESWMAIRAANRGVKRLRRKLEARDAVIEDLSKRGVADA